MNKPGTFVGVFRTYSVACDIQDKDEEVKGAGLAEWDGVRVQHQAITSTSLIRDRHCHA